MEVTTYIIIFVALAIGVRILRGFFTWADWLPYIAIPASTALMWYLNGAGAGIGTFFLSLFTMAYLSGLMAKTTVHYNRGRYSLDCPKCSYGNVEILSQDDNVVKVKCKRCGKHHSGTNSAGNDSGIGPEADHILEIFLLYSCNPPERQPGKEHKRCKDILHLKNTFSQPQPQRNPSGLSYSLPTPL